MSAEKKIEREAADEYFEAVYTELKKLAHALLRGEPCAAINTTALVHEAFLKMLNVKGFHSMEPSKRKGLTAYAMRQVLVDLARKRKASKRDGWLVPMDREPADPRMGPELALAIDSAIGKLEELNPRHARIVEMKCFGGFRFDEIAADLELSVSTVERDWRALKAWLSAEVGWRE